MRCQGEPVAWWRPPQAPGALRLPGLLVASVARTRAQPASGTSAQLTRLHSLPRLQTREPHANATPVRCYKSIAHIAMERRMWPVRNPFHQPLLDGVEVHVGDVGSKIIRVADGVFP